MSPSSVKPSFPNVLLASIQVLIISISSISASSAKVYRWEEPDGTVVYSDEAGPNAKEVDVKPLPTVNLPVPPRSSSATQPQENAVGQRYDTLAITSPAHDATIRDNSGKISVSVSISPALKNNHRLQFQLDGSPASPLGTSTNAVIEGVSRGSHQLSVQVFSETGKAIQSSGSITIHVFRHSILHN